MKRLFNTAYENINFNKEYKLPDHINRVQEDEGFHPSIFIEDEEVEETSNNINKEFETNHFDPDFDGESELE